MAEDTFNDLVDDIVATSPLLLPGWQLIARDGRRTVVSEADAQGPMLSWTVLEELWRAGG